MAIGTKLHTYSGVAAFWHWLSAALVLAQFYTGYMFAEVLDRGTAERTDMFTWHKTFGVTLLLVALLRVVTRFFKPAPRLPSQLAGWEKAGANISHFLLYLFIVAIPLGGLAAVSDRGPVQLQFGITIPAIPGMDEALSDTAGDAHATFVWVFAGLLVIHILAAIYHQSRRSAAAGRMWPFKGPAR